MPRSPRRLSIQSRTVVLSWTADRQRSPITGYTVTSTANNYRSSASTTCTLDGLTNNVEYNFVVTASNKVGTSDPSLPSETARPDVRPDTPAPPTLQFGDRSLTVSWVPPRSEGSPVTSYTLEISPAPPSGIVQKTASPEPRSSGMASRTGRRTRCARAHNKAPDPSEFSPGRRRWCRPESRTRPPRPRRRSCRRWARRPDPGRLEGARQQRRRDLRVRAARPARRFRGEHHPGLGSQTSQAVKVDTSTTDYTFDVRAQNKAGWGDRSPQSAPRRGVTRPAAPTGVAATEGNNAVGVTWQAGSGNGANANEIQYQYSVNGGGWRGDWVGGGTNGAGTIGNGQVNNNGTYTIRVRAVSTVDGSTYASGASNDSNAVSPYGPIGNPSANAAASGTNITYSWSSPSRNGATSPPRCTSTAASSAVTRAAPSRAATATARRTASRCARARPVRRRRRPTRHARSMPAAPAAAGVGQSGDYVPGGGCVNGCYTW
jgi:hypothetical protein